jgi:ABC-type multidrug transport system ATPase subunit
VIEAIGLTSAARRNVPPAVADLSFQVRRGEVTGLLGPAGSGKSTALRLLLGVEAGRGVTLVDGRPLQESPDLVREIGAVLGDVPGHPRRTVRGHLRMLCAAYGLPMARAEEVLEAVGLEAVAQERMETLSLALDRRLGLAVALLPEPSALVLDDPARGLLPREAAWVHDLVRRHAAAGGAVLLAGRDAGALSRTADHVIALDQGRLVADEASAAFARSRLRPYVAVRSPYAHRLAEVLRGGGAEVVADGGSRIAVYGTSSAEVGETAYRHGILLHQLADAEPVRLDRPASASAATAATVSGAARAEPGRNEAAAEGRSVPRPRRGPAGRPVRRVSGRRGPARPVSYEVRRAYGVRTPWPTLVGALVCSVLATVLLVRAGSGPSASPLRLLSGWAPELPLPAAAVGAGLLGALSYGQEFRYPALSPGHGPEPRSPRLLVAKLAVGAVTALLLAAAATAADTAVLRLLWGGRVPDPIGHPAAMAMWGLLAVACCWAGVLAAAVLRTTALGVSAVLAVPLLVVPGVRMLLGGHGSRELAEAGDALWSVVSGVSQDGHSRAAGVLALAGQPLVLGLALVMAALICAYAASTVRARRSERRAAAALSHQPSGHSVGDKG